MKYYCVYSQVCLDVISLIDFTNLEKLELFVQISFTHLGQYLEFKIMATTLFKITVVIQTQAD